MKMKRAAPVAVVLGVAAYVLSACGASSPTAAPSPSAIAAPLQAVVFAFGDLTTFTQAGDTTQVTALGVFSTGPARNITAACAAWQSDDTSVLTVTSSGLLTAQAASGSATITTTCQGIGARGLVTMNPPPSPIVSAPPVEGPGQPTSPGVLCLNPPYHFNELAQRCQEDKGGQFAKNECCGLPPAGGK